MKCLNPVVEFRLEVLRIGVTWRVFTREKALQLQGEEYIFSVKWKFLIRRRRRKGILTNLTLISNNP